MKIHGKYTCLIFGKDFLSFINKWSYILYVFTWSFILFRMARREEDSGMKERLERTRVYSCNKGSTPR